MIDEIFRQTFTFRKTLLNNKWFLSPQKHFFLQNYILFEQKIAI